MLMITVEADAASYAEAAGIIQDEVVGVVGDAAGRVMVTSLTEADGTFRATLVGPADVVGRLSLTLL